MKKVVLVFVVVVVVVAGLVVCSSQDSFFSFFLVVFAWSTNARWYLATTTSNVSPLPVLGEGLWFWDNGACINHA